MGFPCGSDGKASAYNVGDQGLTPGWGRSSGEGNGNPLQYSCLENPMGEAMGSDTTERLYFTYGGLKHDPLRLKKKNTKTSY